MTQRPSACARRRPALRQLEGRHTPQGFSRHGPSGQRTDRAGGPAAGMLSARHPGRQLLGSGRGWLCVCGGGRPRTPGSSQARAPSRSAGHTSAEARPQWDPRVQRRAQLTANSCISAPILDFSGTLRGPIFNPKRRSQCLCILIVCIILRTWLKPRNPDKFNPQKLEFTQTYLQTLQSSPINFPSRKRPTFDFCFTCFERETGEERLVTGGANPGATPEGPDQATLRGGWGATGGASERSPHICEELTAALLPVQGPELEPGRV